MKILKKLATLAAVSALAHTASAAFISGNIGIGLKDGSSVNFDGTTVSFSAGPNGTVNIANGDYAGLGGSDATYHDFDYNPFVASDVWEITLTPTTKFALTSVSILFESASFLTLSGSGVASITGMDDTTGSWSFSADKSGGAGSFNFSSTTSVPDSGATLALLGLGLVGIAAASRRFKK